MGYAEPANNSFSPASLEIGPWQFDLRKPPVASGGQAGIYDGYAPQIGRGAVKIYDHVGVIPEGPIEAQQTVRLAALNERVCLEAARMAALGVHRHILPAYGYKVYHNETKCAVAMPFCEGGSVQDQLDDGKIYTPLEAVLLSTQMTSALQFAHSYGLIHRDVKPANMLYENTDRDTLRLTDLGIAALQSDKIYDRLATAGYAAPEQYQERPSIFSDQHALGATIYQMLAGRRPFADRPDSKIPAEDRDSAIAAEQQRQFSKAHIPTFTEVQGFSTPELDALYPVLVRALSFEEKERFPSMSAFGIALEEALGNCMSVAERTLYFPDIAKRQKARELVVAGKAVLDAASDVAGYTDALKYFVEAVREDSTSIPAKYHAAETLARAGFLERARRGFASVVELPERSAEDFFMKGKVLASLGRYDEAMACFENSTSRSQSDQALHEMAQAFESIADTAQKKGDAEHALIVYEKALQLWEDLGVSERISVLFDKISQAMSLRSLDFSRS